MIDLARRDSIIFSSIFYLGIDGVNFYGRSLKLRDKFKLNNGKNLPL